MANPAQPAKKSPWVVFLGIVTALGIVFGISVLRMPPTVEEIPSPEPVAAAPAEPEPIIPARVPVPDPPPPAPPTLQSGQTVEPEPVVAAVEPAPTPAPPKPVVDPVKVEPPKVVAKAEPPKQTAAPKAEAPPAPPPKPAPAPTAVPMSLIVSATGKTPACVASCTWGNLDESGFPEVVNDTRTVVCEDGNTWHVATIARIPRGGRANCYTASGISAP